MDKSPYKQIWILIIASLLVVCAYQFIDRPVVFWAAAHDTRQYKILIWLTHLSDIWTGIFFIAYPLLLLRFYYQKRTYHDRALLALANSFVVTTFFKATLKTIFGRYWPATWTHNNPSLLQDSVYGFNWFQHGSAYGSFPSGHVAITTAVMTLLAIAYPRMRWLAVLIVLLMAVSQITLYYHFVSDAIAGAALGYIVASAVAAMAKIKN